MVGVKDYELHIRVKNGPMLALMRLAGFESAQALAKAADVWPSEVGFCLNLKDPPIRKDGKWRPQVLRIAEALRCLPEDMFPPQHLHVALPSNKAVVPVSLDEIAGFLGETRSPEEMIAERETASILAEQVAILPDRERLVLTWRFGLDGEGERTLATVGEHLGVSPERARGIEARALRRMRERAPKTIGRARL